MRLDFTKEAAKHVLLLRKVLSATLQKVREAIG